MCQRVMDARGYLVICTYDKHSPGDLLWDCFAGDKPRGELTLDVPLVCLGETNFEDMIEQVKLMRYPIPPPNPSAYFYRAVSE